MFIWTLHSSSVLLESTEMCRGCTVPSVKTNKLLLFTGNLRCVKQGEKHFGMQWSHTTSAKSTTFTLFPNVWQGKLEDLSHRPVLKHRATGAGFSSYRLSASVVKSRLHRNGPWRCQNWDFFINYQYLPEGIYYFWGIFFFLLFTLPLSLFLSSTIHFK